MMFGCFFFKCLREFQLSCIKWLNFQQNRNKQNQGNCFRTSQKRSTSTYSIMYFIPNKLNFNSIKLKKICKNSDGKSSTFWLEWFPTLRLNMFLFYLGSITVCIPAIHISITSEQIMLLLKAKSLVDWYCNREKMAYVFRFTLYYNEVPSILNQVKILPNISF